MSYLRHMHPWSEDGECVAEIVHGAPDAHLIGAAPDMYEALDEIVELKHRIKELEDLLEEWLDSKVNQEKIVDANEKIS